jgi:hypothetical protein
MFCLQYLSKFVSLFSFLVPGLDTHSTRKFIILSAFAFWGTLS